MIYDTMYNVFCNRLNNIKCICMYCIFSCKIILKLWLRSSRHTGILQVPPHQCINAPVFTRDANAAGSQSITSRCQLQYDHAKLHAQWSR